MKQIFLGVNNDGSLKFNTSGCDIIVKYDASQFEVDKIYCFILQDRPVTLVARSNGKVYFKADHQVFKPNNQVPDGSLIINGEKAEAVIKKYFIDQAAREEQKRLDESKAIQAAHESRRKQRELAQMSREHGGVFGNILRRIK